MKLEEKDVSWGRSLRYKMAVKKKTHFEEFYREKAGRLRCL
jgi:hypothetical protein